MDDGIRMVFAWFGNRPFRVSDINDERVQALWDVLGLSARTPQGKRGQVGRYPSAMDGQTCLTASEPTLVIKLVVLIPAGRIAGGVYQVQEVLDDHRETVPLPPGRVPPAAQPPAGSARRDGEDALPRLRGLRRSPGGRLARELRAVVAQGARQGRKTAMMVLFGIMYADELKSVNVKELVARAGIGPNAGVEVSMGRSLADYVDVKPEYRRGV